ncbi:MAG: DUF423 domain-containing protein [bacterium]|jgi:uncharacterized membrane protein YgdD (TMEM256/DUF423 family)
MTKKYLITVAILGIWAILMLFLDAEVFVSKMDLRSNSVYNLAITSQMVHIVALLAMTFMNRYLSRSYLNNIYYLFTIGIVLFSGGLYIRATEGFTNLIIGFTPLIVYIGALSLLGGWLMILITGFTYKHKKRAIQNQ